MKEQYKKIVEFLSLNPNERQEQARNQQLEDLERQITAFRSQQLLSSPIEGSFDFQHLATIHQFLFDGLLTQSGQLRPHTDFWGKDFFYEGHSYVCVFANASDVLTIFEGFHQYLFKSDHFNYLYSFGFINEITEAYAKLNYLHPFVEGNGRTLRIFFYYLCQNAGFHLNLQYLSGDEWDFASMKACDNYLVLENENIAEQLDASTHYLYKIFKRAITRK